MFLARASTHTLIEDLKSQAFFKHLGAAAAGSLQPTDKAPISVLSGSLPTSASNTAGPVLILDAALGELFLPYTDKYIEREQKSLTEIYAAYLAKFTRWHVGRALRTTNVGLQLSCSAIALESKQS